MVNRSIDQLEDVLNYCDDIISFCAALDNDLNNFLESRQSQYSISFCIEQIGELIKKLRDAGLAEKYPDVAWNEIAGLRNRIAHGYFAIDLRMVFDIGINDIPKLRRQCSDILELESMQQGKECQMARRQIHR